MSFPKFYWSVKRFWLIILIESRTREEEAASVEAVRAGVEFKGSTILILVFAIFIASLGLNTNSAAVIIGAMLISPLMGPIMGIGLRLGINDIWVDKTFFSEFGSRNVVQCDNVDYLLLGFTLNEARSELLARTSPTIYDVLIAFFGGLAGIVAMSSKQKGNVLPVSPLPRRWCRRCVRRDSGWLPVISIIFSERFICFSSIRFLLRSQRLWAWS